jgi:GNAT superfamily N-acetyltransferase
LILMKRELPLEAMHSLVDAAGKCGATAFLSLLRDVARGQWHPTERGECFFVAWEKSVVVAVLALCDAKAGPAPRVAHLRGLFVRPDRRRRGVGSTLIARALRHANSTHAEVRIRDPDPEHARFYEASGLTRGHERSTWVRAIVRVGH